MTHPLPVGTRVGRYGRQRANTATVREFQGPPPDGTPGYVPGQTALPLVPHQPTLGSL